MLQYFVDFDAAAVIIHGWSVEKIVEIIKEGELTAYARIHCGPHDDSTLDDSYDDDEKYEIARITDFKEKPSSSSPRHTEWFFVHYEPIDNVLEKNERESEYYCANLASDNYCGQRVFGYLKSKSSFQDLVSTEQLCLLSSDILSYLSGDKAVEKSPAQLLAERRHKTSDRDVYVSEIMKRIKEESKKADQVLRFINHHRFINEAGVPKNLYKSILDQMRLRIEVDYNGFYKPLSRRPKMKREDYFLFK